MRATIGALIFLAAATVPAHSEESIWIEAEHLRGVRGYCWPAGPDPKTDGHWGISGPGWAAEWTQGGESGFLSIACGAADDRAAASTDLDVPVAGRYRVWVRYRDSREAPDRFQVRLTPAGGPPTTLTYGERAVVEEDNELKLYWDWAFAWESGEARLPAGKVALELRSAFKERGCRQVDCLVLTTDPAYRPHVKERPDHPTRRLLDGRDGGIDPAAEPLARHAEARRVPEAWAPRTFRDKGFLYLWNMDQVKWAGDDPRRVPHPYHLRDPETLAAFEAKYAGAAEVPIFADPRIVPTFHGAGPGILATDDPDPARKKAAGDFVRWLDAHPDRPWGLMMNYAPDAPVSPAARANFLKYRDRFVGNIAGESLGYFNVDPKTLEGAAAGARTRRELAAAYTPLALAANAAKQRAIFGADWPAGGAYREVIPCQSIAMTAFAPLCYAWGARTVGYESAAITSGLLGLRMAFLRGAARQYGGLTATYRSCNFGDASTLFSEAQSYTKPRNILDNFYGVYSGAGMTWYKMDLWHQYLSGSSFAYHEQGFDEFWMPGGTTAAGLKPVQLSPKGKLVDRFLRVTAAHPDRGAPYTPVAFLVDHAHGWDPAPFAPHAFNGELGRSELTRPGDHERMLREYFWAAYHPIGRLEGEPTTATSEVYVPGRFGDIFDVIYADPDPARWTTIDTYPVVVAAGDIELTAAEGRRLAGYVERGGTLLVAEAQLSGPGVAALGLPAPGEVAEADAYTWSGEATRHESQRFRLRPIAGGRPLAATPAGAVFCAAFDRGAGRLVVLSVPRGLGVDGVAVPAVPRLLNHLTRGLMPVEVRGEVEWLVNRTASGWIVTLLNPAGQAKPQQGVTPTDPRGARAVVLRTASPPASAADWLEPELALAPRPDGSGSTIELMMPAGSVRVVELKDR